MRERLLVADRVRTAAGVLGNALLIRDGRIAGVGAAGQLRRPNLSEERYPGGVVIPGLRDAHFHPVGYAAVLARPSLKNVPDFDALADRLSEAGAELPTGMALTALRLDDESLAERRLPDREDLDRMVPDRPVLLTRYCAHIAVVNTAALEAAGISPRTPDPPGGSLDRDTDGRPTGVLRETAVNLVTEALRHLVPPVTPQRLGEALRGLPALGLTGVGAIASLDAGCWAGTGSELDILCEVGGDLPAKLSVLVQASTPHELETAAERVEAAGRHFRFLGLKAFSDGSLGGHTAAMRTPYHDRPDTTGTHRLDPGWAHEMSQAALSLGGRVAVHAIGDAANSRVLDLFERVIADGGDPARLRVEHASVLTDEDVDRLAATGATASVQPAFLASEIGWLEKRVGPERINQTYPFRTLRDRGVPLAGGSDCPVEPPHPLWGMAAARDRAGIVPKQGLDPTDALALFTDGAARAIGEDASLMVGSAADVVVLDRDPVEASPNELREAEVIATWVNGEAVELLPQAWVA